VKRILFTPTTIEQCTPAGITYRDATGTVYSFSFTECRSNWANYVNTSQEFSATTVTEQTTLCVAWRDFFANPPYIEFFSEPRTRFEFQKPQSWFEWLRFPNARRWREDFLILQHRIHAVGCKSYDLG
jgi:hypothetical protein